VPGSGVAGTVTAVGEGVEPGWLGRWVVTDTGAHGGSGGYAEEVTAPVERLIEVPDGVDLRQAAALLHDGARRYALPRSLRSNRTNRCWCSARLAGWASCSSSSRAKRVPT
jgi:NADPH:quinone reductase-like Zn-dependent oxidoreductase